MSHIIGGYLRSSGPLNVPVFATSNTLTQLASASTGSQYLIPDYAPIADQLSLNSCVANATTSALEMLKGLENPNSIQLLSRLFCYWNSRSYTSSTNIDQGCYIHNALDSLTRLGVCEESVWPYSTSEVFTQPPIAAYKEGNDNTITAFYQITSQGNNKLNDIELAIRANHPVVFGTTVGTEFEAYDGGPQVLDITTQPVGGHALLIVGIRTNASGQREFCIRNSWSSNWGIGGHVWFSSNYIMWDDTSDLFVPTRMDNLLV